MSTQGEADISQRIQRRLADEGIVGVGVEEEDETILLSGTVSSDREREAAEQIALAAAPGSRIDNSVEVEVVVPGNDAAMAEEALESNVAEAVEESDEETYFPPTDPVVTTDERGRAVVLGGFGETSMDEDAPARSIEGGVGDEAIAEAVRRELHEDALTTDLAIEVDVRNGVVTLRGDVRDLDDAEYAQSVAARVRGVADVVDELNVPQL